MVKKRVLLGSFGLVETSLQQMREREVWGGGKERDRQTDRQTETERDRERQRQRDRDTETERQRQTHREDILLYYTRK